MSIKLMKQRWLSETSEAKEESNSASIMEVDDPEELPEQNASEMPKFLSITEREVLCDENLIKEAKVVRCLCEPTESDLVAGLGCGEDCINRELYMECGSRCPSGTRCTNRRFQNREYAKIEAFNAGIKGWGLRAVEPIESGRFIIEYIGQVISSEEMLRRGRMYGKDPNHHHHYLMALKNGAVIDATIKGNISRFINHSCDPNCQSQKWTVNRELRIGFFALKSIAAGEEIVFDYQLERYGRKPQKCFCGARNCRGWIGEDIESEDEDVSESDDVDEGESDENIPTIEPRKTIKRPTISNAARKSKAKEKERAMRNHEKAIEAVLSRGPPRNREQVKDLVRLMVQVEQASQRSSLLQCFRFAHRDILRLFMDECGLRLLYVFLATDYPVEDARTVLDLQIKSLELLNAMPIATRNQVNDSHILATVIKLASTPVPTEEVVEGVVQRLVNAACSEEASTSSDPSTKSAFDDRDLEFMHQEMVENSSSLIKKWRSLRQEFRIPRRERSDTPLSDDYKSEQRRGSDDESRERRRSVIPEKKSELQSWTHRIIPKCYTPPRSSSSSEKDKSDRWRGSSPSQILSVNCSSRCKMDVGSSSESDDVSPALFVDTIQSDDKPSRNVTEKVVSKNSSLNVDVVLPPVRIVPNNRHIRARSSRSENVIVLPPVRLGGSSNAGMPNMTNYNTVGGPPSVMGYMNEPCVDVTVPPPTALPSMLGPCYPETNCYPDSCYVDQCYPDSCYPDSCYSDYSNTSYSFDAMYAYNSTTNGCSQFSPYCQPQFTSPPCPQADFQNASSQSQLTASASTVEPMSILSPPSPPAKPPKTEKPVVVSSENVDSDEEPTDEQIELLENKLARMKEKVALRKKRLLEAANKELPPPPPPLSSVTKLWVQAVTEDGSVYYYNKETRESSWTLPEEKGSIADTTSDHNDYRAEFKIQIVKHVSAMLEPIRKTKFASADDYKYVLRKLTHTILDKESKRVGETELRVTESVKDKARKYVMEYITKLKDGQYNRKNKHHNIY